MDTKLKTKSFNNMVTIFNIMLGNSYLDACAEIPERRFNRQKFSLSSNILVLKHVITK